MDVEIEGLRFERAGRVVLQIPSLKLHENRTTAILGPNGAGKTTLLRLVAALECPQEGIIRIGGRIIRPDVRIRQNVAYVFQEQVFLRQSVRDNLDLGLRLRGVHKTERTKRIEEAADMLGIAQLLDRGADCLSGGEGRRASLARALCLRAPLVLLDEPLAGLDPATHSRLLDELPKLLRAFGATTLLVTHDGDEALRLGQDLVVLLEGRVHAAGDKRDVALNPAETTVAEVLGYSVLFVEGRRLAVPPGALRFGTGPSQFWMVVEELLDLVDRREIVGWIGDVRVHVTAPTAAEMPKRGDRLLVHAVRACDMR
jgi:putative spermidine/putrescine transport system ATP-binding protein